MLAMLAICTSTPTRPPTRPPTLPPSRPLPPSPSLALQDWEQEEVDAYAIFEAGMAALQGPAGGRSTGAASKMLRQRGRGPGAPAGAAQPSASQRRLAKNKLGQSGWALPGERCQKISMPDCLTYIVASC